MDVHPTKNVSIGIDPYPYHNISVWPLQIVKKIDDLNIFKHLNHHMASRIAMKHPYGQWRFHI
jgi:hypothetical protein